MKEKEYIWLFGENNSATCNNNSFYFWEHVVLRKDNIKKYFILDKNKKNEDNIKKLDKNKRKYIVWKNSIKHYLLYKNADMFFVSLSYKDISPNKVLFKSIRPKVINPIIYLQHGTIGMKRLGYSGTSYNNNMFRFMIYNKSIMEQYKKENDFKSYQLYYAKYHPRYKELILRNDEYQKNKKQKQILWFITWREYLGQNKETQKLINNIKYIVNNMKLNEFLKKNDYKLKICVHQFFDRDIINSINESEKENIQIFYPNSIDVMDEIVKSDVVITDYSSIGYDSTFLNKPVILYQPDLETYMKNRTFYCPINEMKKYSIKSSKELIEKIISNDFEINEFLKNGIPEDVDYQYVREGKHIDKMYDDLSNMQNNKITFIGYNFYGIGGTVSATKALAEALMEKGYMVELISLKKIKASSNELPYGVNVKALYIAGSRKKKELIKRLFRTDIWYSYLKYDKNKNNLIPYVGYALRNKLKHMKSKTVVSTRESLHLFLKDAKSNYIENKLYFFHTDAKVLKNSFPKVMQQLKKVTLENALFVTETNKEDYKKIYDYDNYENSMVIGNTVESKISIPIDEIEETNKKGKIQGIILTRISIDRTDDINNIIEFGNYLKINKKNNIVINVYGKGDYLDEFQKKIEENKISRYIKYGGILLNPQEEIRKNDFVLDLSNNQSFGMIYLEAIFNGRMVFCKRNVGSLETLKELPECYYENYDELTSKIEKVKNIKKDELEKNYKIIYEKYSRDSVANMFLKMIEGR